MIAIDAVKPCVRCNCEIPAYPAIKKYCADCRIVVTREQWQSHKAKLKAAKPTTIETSCPSCGNAFSYSTSRGHARKYCSHQCSRRASMAAHSERLKSLGNCSVDGCANGIERVGARMCEMHYMLVRRNGVPARQWTVRHRYTTSAGYVIVKRVGHPLASQAGNVGEHRLVMFEAHSGICQPCYWCSAALTWESAVIDHKNENKSDNDLSNLVFACGQCNRARGAIIPFLTRCNPALLDEAIGLMRSFASLHHDKRTARGE